MAFIIENDKPVSNLGDNPEAEARKGWELVCAIFNSQSDDRITLENVEIVE